MLLGGEGLRTPKLHPVPPVELVACVLRQGVTVPGPGDRMGERADADREREGWPLVLSPQTSAAQRLPLTRERSDDEPDVEVHAF